MAAPGNENLKKGDLGTDNREIGTNDADEAKVRKALLYSGLESVTYYNEAIAGFERLMAELKTARAELLQRTPARPRRSVGLPKPKPETPE